MMPDEPERDYYVEAWMILKGLNGLMIEKRHLEAMQEHHEVAMIKVFNMLQENGRTVLGMS